MTVRQLRVALARSPLAPREARHLVRDRLEEWSLDGLVDDVLLLVSELVTNAIHHAGSDIELCVQVDGGVVRVEVRDASPALPVQQAMSHDALRGRGIGIVASAATRWGVDAIPGDGKSVWFEVAG